MKRLIYAAAFAAVAAGVLIQVLPNVYIECVWTWVCWPFL